MFQSFFTTKGAGSGTGLGLSISLKIIESHHGSLTLDPELSNTRFIVKLPKK
jgi:two-component system NtrC family sensor kinase